MSRLVVHVGYPKTATTTFQKYVYPYHSQIDYMGKMIPGFNYVDEELGIELDKLMRADETRYQGTERLRKIIDEKLSRSGKEIVLISSEPFVDNSVTDRGVIARRLRSLSSECKVIITIREQLSAIKSYFNAHGRFGYNLFLVKAELEHVRMPMSIDTWLKLSCRSLDKNFVGALFYHDVIRHYQALFGHANVGVYLYEEFCMNKKSFLNRLCGFIGIDGHETLQLLGDHHENYNYSSAEILYMKGLSCLGIESARGRLSGRHSGISGYLRNKFGPAKIDIPEEWEGKLKDMYKNGNRELCGMGLPLGKYGYLF